MCKYDVQRHIDLFISLACIASKNCVTCTEDSQMCSSCDVAGNEYLKEDDSSCVAVGACTGAYFWDDVNKLCKRTYLRKHFYNQN